MAHPDQSSCPVLRTTTGLHADQTGLAIRKMLEKHGALQLPAYDLTRVNIKSMKLEDVLRDIYTDRRILHFGPPG
jgi:hypothetical protein